MDRDVRDIEITDGKEWVIVAIRDRVDSFNFVEWAGKMENLMLLGQKHVAFNLAHAKFLSLPSIKYLGAMADSMGAQGRHVALVAPSEKLKRQIDIYGQLEKLKLFRSELDLIP